MNRVSLHRPLGACCLAVAIGMAVQQPAIAEILFTTVFKSGTDGYHTYRIPAIVQATNGDLLAFAEGRKLTRYDHGDIDIVLKRSTDAGATWGEMQVVQDEWANPTGHITIGNPVPVVDRLDPKNPGRIWLAFCRDNIRVFVIFSDDHGATWSERREITSSAKDPFWVWYATGPVHGIQLERGEHAGRLIIPSDHRVENTGALGSHVLYSSDHGETWKIGAVDTHELESPILPNEHVAVELTDGRVYFNTRDQFGTDSATRGVTHSSDGGLTYDGPFRPEPSIITPIVQNSVVRFKAIDRGDSQNVLIYSGPNGKKRADMTIWASFDEGETWTRKTLLDSGPAAYSDLVKIDDERIGAFYEGGGWLYDELIFASLGLEDLEGQE